MKNRKNIFPKVRHFGCQITSAISAKNCFILNFFSAKRTFFHLPFSFLFLLKKAPNGWRYPLVGGTRQRHFDGTNSKPRKLPACTLPQAQVKTRRVPPVGCTLCWAALIVYIDTTPLALPDTRQFGETPTLSVPGSRLLPLLWQRQSHTLDRALISCRPELIL